MKTSRKVLLAIAASASLVASVPAFAQSWHHRGPRVVFYAPPPVVYARPPVYYSPPVVYAPVRPYYYRPVMYAYPRWHTGFRR
jgi:hypothetical protein